MTEDNNLLTKKHMLIHFNSKSHEKLEFIKANFCGIVIVVTDLDDFEHSENVKENTICYMAGEIEAISEIVKTKGFELIYVIKELSYDYDVDLDQVIGIDQVPINVHNIGVYFTDFFHPKNYFNLISTEHQFQTLTESNKQSNAFRTGIYLSKVEEVEEASHFNILRCSTNFEGPTENFCKTDNDIIDKINNISSYFYEHKTQFNHVLAQIYENSKINGVEKKAKIKQHSDKTKDMPRHGLIAFCTFYDNKTLMNSKTYYIGKSPVLTTLRFRLKTCVKDDKYAQKVDVILYPNSVFIISLLTNRLYTHEIVPSPLPIEKIPTRMGYVIRCSNIEAISKDGQTYIFDGDTKEYVALKKPDEAGVKALKDNYYKENMTADVIDYGQVHFSLNDGDYMKPNCLFSKSD